MGEGRTMQKQLSRTKPGTRVERAFTFHPLSLREVRRGSRECPVDFPAVERVQVKFLRPGGNQGEGKLHQTTPASTRVAMGPTPFRARLLVDFRAVLRSAESDPIDLLYDPLNSLTRIFCAISSDHRWLRTAPDRSRSGPRICDRSFRGNHSRPRENPPTSGAGAPATARS